MNKNKSNSAKRITADFLKTKSASISEADLDRVNERSEAIIKKFRENISLRRFIKESVLFLGIVKDYVAGNYCAVPWWVISAIVFTLLYVLNPFDLIPEFIPGIGYIDDAAVVTVCLGLISQELQSYEEWKGKQQRSFKQNHS